MEEIKITSSDIKKRADIFLVEYFKNQYPRAKISGAIEKGIFLFNEKSQKPSYKLRADDIITFEKGAFDALINPDLSLIPWDFKLDIRYEDDDVIVINKPKNMLTHPTKFDRMHTLSNALLSHCGNNLSNLAGDDRLGIVHRLDKNTSGLMIAAKNNSAHENLALQIKEKIAKRKYLAIALGEFSEKQGIIDKALVHYLKSDVKMTIAKEGEGLSAITHFRVAEEFLGAALVELELKTGRTHQIRAHLASVNHPVFGDSLYGSGGLMRNEFYNLKTQEQLLQSYYLSFNHPKTGEFMEFELKEEEFSSDFIKVLKYLRSKNAY